MSSQESPFDPESITSRLYAAVSGEPGQWRIEEASALLHPDVQMIRTGVTAEGKPEQNVMTFRAYRENVADLLADASFYETEVSQEAFRFGLVASIRSVYEKRLQRGQTVEEGRGINLINLVCGEDGWRIVSIIWDNEREGLALPAGD
jgi:hypothetical protein